MKPGAGAPSVDLSLAAYLLDLVVVERCGSGGGDVAGAQVRAGTLGPPKTDAGRRSVALPPSLARTLVRHMDQHVEPAPDALVFATRTGGYLARSG